jgi:hypothetical protein
MSGSAGRAQSFGIRLALDGADAVESGIRRVQQTAQTATTSIEQTGQSAGRALAVIDRGTAAASAGLTKMGGDFAALAPIVDNAGGAVGRLVLALGSGAGLLGALGAVGAAVSAAVALYQNWDTVSRAVGSAVDYLTGRVRLNETAINDANAALRSYLQLSESATQAGNRRFIETQRTAGDQARDRLTGLDGQIAALEADRARAAAGGSTGAIVRRGGASGLVPTDDFGRAADQAVIDRAARQQADRVRQIDADLDTARRARAGQQAIVDRSDAAIAGAVTDQSNANPGRFTPEPEARPAARGGGGGGASRVNDALREREALIQRNQTADERYAAGLSRIAELNDRLIAQGNEPLPDDVVQREAARLMEEYERATRSAADSTTDLAERSKELERAGAGAAKALTGAFEDLVFEGRNFDDVLKNLERSLLRVGNQALLQPLFQQGFDALLGGGQGGGRGGAAAGGAGGIAGLLGSFFGSSGGAKGTVDALTAAGTLVSTFHQGGVVGAGGAPMRMASAGLFANAPRYHTGGIIGPDEVPIIARRGEVIRTPEQEAALMGRGVTININGVRDVQGFHASRGQVLADISRAVGRGSRNR